MQVGDTVSAHAQIETTPTQPSNCAIDHHVFDLATMAESSRASCSAPAPKVRKTDPTEKRCFLLSYFHGYLWTTIATVWSVLTVLTRRTTSSQQVNKFKKDSLRKRALTVNHRAALEARSARKDMQRAVKRSQVFLLWRQYTSWQKRTLLTISLETWNNFWFSK